MELWGGLECTVNRVRDAFHNQLEANGHWNRSVDLELFATLGIRRLRYPVLWELTAPDSIDRCDWRWADERLPRLRTLKIEPIVGLLHHGSGPRYTDLLDPHFPELFARYARQVAERFAWVSHYTPINEPLTTARFSALYGHWYPHARDDRSFVAALVNQCRAIVLAMRAIREVNSEAQLIQTEDLGQTRSTPPLVYQARFENERRWLSWDLLCGRVDSRHPLWNYLTASGFQEHQRQWFEQNACTPQMLGINHYVTSNRFLDHRVRNFPPQFHGSNGRHRYVDLDAVRAIEEPTTIDQLIDETWQRYRLPLAITEAHLGCSREEQLRWFHEIWRRCQQAQRQGADVRAVTMWSLLGSFDWNSLLTRCDGHYEPGAFDVRGPQPRPTALAGLLCDLGSGRQLHCAPLLTSPGWWDRPERFIATKPPPVGVKASRISMVRPSSPLLIAGASGTLGQAFAKICGARALPVRVCDRRDLDICDSAAIERMLDETRPWALINSAGYVDIDRAEHETERCYRENLTGALRLAVACAKRRIRFMTFSSDLVFDGCSLQPYIESDAVHPLSIYGWSKARAEQAVLSAYPAALVIRTSSFFGPWDEHNFLTRMLRTLAGGQTFVAMNDVIVSPTYVPDLVNAALDLLIDDEHGLWHLVNHGNTSWAELALHTAKLARVATTRLTTEKYDALGLPARRPAFSALTSERGLLMPGLENAVARYVDEISFG